MKQENKMSPTSRYLHVDVDDKTRPTHDAEITRLTALVAEQQRKIAELEKERDNARAEVSWLARLLMKTRNSFSFIVSDIEDDGDRAYFGSTNDADTLRDIRNQMETWEQSRLMRDGAWVDYITKCAEANAKLRALQSSARQMKEALEFYESDEHWRVNGKLDPNGPNFIGQLHARAALQSAASLGLGPDWCKEAEPSFKFELGAPVRKVSGYQFDGYVRMRGRLPQGERYVVESEASPGLLHIFSDAQLEPRAKGGGDADH
jgi:hypothetical protein